MVYLLSALDLAFLFLVSGLASIPRILEYFRSPIGTKVSKSSHVPMSLTNFTYCLRKQKISAFGKKERVKMNRGISLESVCNAKVMQTIC